MRTARLLQQPGHPMILHHLRSMTHACCSVQRVTASLQVWRLVHAPALAVKLGAPVQDVPAEERTSMLVLSEFVGCSPSVSGAIRVNPWSVDDVADRIHEVLLLCSYSLSQLALRLRSLQSGPFVSELRQSRPGSCSAAAEAAG